jgi:hypothetical protein
MTRRAGFLDIVLADGMEYAHLFHRSSKEFLLNTEEGRDILGYNMLAVEERISVIIIAGVAMDRIQSSLHGILP